MAGIRLYKDINFGGTTVYLTHPYYSYRYLKIDKPYLDELNFNDKLSSLKAISWLDQRETAILFEHPGYTGRFLAFECKDPSQDIPNLGGQYNFNDTTSSILLVEHSDREYIPIHIAEMAREDATGTVDEYLESDSRIVRNGELIFSWAMWPSFNTWSKFVTIKIPVKVKVPSWFDYNAWIKYYIYLYIDSLYRLRGYVSAVETWVESGILSGSISNQLHPKAVEGADVVNAFLNDTLTELDFHEWEEFYYMPGVAPWPIPENYSGHTEDDVSVILIRRES